MTYQLQKLALVAVVGLVGVGTALADVGDRKTTVTTEQAMLLPTMTLQPGTYVIKLAKSAQTRFNTVQFFDKNERHLVTTVIAYPNERIRPTGKSVFSFWEVPAGQPRALRAWFYPGDADGQEFAYPKAEADRISANNNNAKVPIDERRDVAKAEPTPVRTEPAPAVPAPAQIAAAPQPPPTPVITPEPERRLSAQNNQNNNDEARRTQSDANRTVSQTASPETLPKTASDIPLIALLGLLAVLGAVAVRSAVWS